MLFMTISYLFIAFCTNQNLIALVLLLVGLPIIQQEELMKWHPSGVTRTRIRVIGVNFSEILIKRKDSDTSKRLHAHSLGWLKAAGKTRVRLKVLLVFSVTRYLSLL